MRSSRPAPPPGDNRVSSESRMRAWSDRRPELEQAAQQQHEHEGRDHHVGPVPLSDERIERKRDPGHGRRHEDEDPELDQSTSAETRRRLDDPRDTPEIAWLTRERLVM